MKRPTDCARTQFCPTLTFLRSLGMCTEVGRRQKQLHFAGDVDSEDWGGCPQEVGLCMGQPLLVLALLVHSSSPPTTFFGTSPRKCLFKEEGKNFKAATIEG